MKTFEFEVYKAAMTLQPRDFEQLSSKYSDPIKQQNILYEEALKALVPIVADNGQVKWVISDNLRQSLPSEGPSSRHSTTSSFTRHRPSTSVQINRDPLIVKNGFPLKKMVGFHSRNNSQSMTKEKLQLPEFNSRNQLINGTKSDSLKVETVIPTVEAEMRSQTYSNSSRLRELSCGSQSRVIYKNIQNEMYIQQATQYVFDQDKKLEIRLMCKKNKVLVRHLMDIKYAFLQCEQVFFSNIIRLRVGQQEQLGLIKQLDFLVKLKSMNLRLSDNFLRYLMDVITEDDEDDEAVSIIESSDKYVSYQRLVALIDIFLQQPSKDFAQANNSDAVKRAIVFQKEETAFEQEQVTKLARYIHVRIEEKYKNYRLAFRALDENYDGYLNFTEFIEGLEKLGVRFSLEDYMKVFSAIDFDENGLVDFSEFCLINMDKAKDILTQIKEIKEAKQSRQQSSLEYQSVNYKKPPLPSMLSSSSNNNRLKNYSFGSGMLPKNKDINQFAKDIQEEGPTYLRLKQKKEIMLPSQSDSSFRYGVKSDMYQDINAIIRNQFQDEESKPSYAMIRFKQQQGPEIKSVHARSFKQTLTQQLRQQAIRKRYKLIMGEDPMSSLILKPKLRIKRQESLTPKAN